MIFEIISRVLMVFLFIMLIIEICKERKGLDKDRPIDRLIIHLLNVEIWIAALFILAMIG